jgi:hypothetical protein
MAKKLLILTLGAAVAAALTTPVRAGTALWGFDDWANGTGGETNLVFAGDATTMLLDDYKQYMNGSTGDPSTNGFLQLTPAVDGRNLAVVFPDIDNGAPIKAFKFTIDVRAGNPADTDGRPADGFSISYVRESDVALSNAAVYVDPVTLRGIAFGYAGGDSCGEATSPSGSATMENGSKSGVSILFDTWQGNTLPNTASNPNCVGGNDVEGFAVRVDDKTLIQVPMGVRNAGCADINSLQTGTFLNDGGLSYTHLEWCKLEVEKTADNKVNVTWKGRKVLDGYQLASYGPHKGRLLLAGRTGGNNQYVHFDNLALDTVPAIEPLLNSFAINADLKGWTIKIEDYLPSEATNVTQVLWNNSDVTASVTTSKAGLITTIGYTQSGRLPANSAQNVQVTVQTSLGQTVVVPASATVMDYFVMPVAYARPLSSVAGSTRGIALGQPWQTVAPNINSQGDNKLNWTEEQLLGLHGPNLITGTVPTSTDVLDYQNSGLTGTASGNFQLGGSTAALWEGVDYDITDLGFGKNAAKLNTDDGTIEWFAYVNFPAAGDYTMTVNSDDGFRLSTARHAKDRMGDVISFFNAGRGNGTGLGAGTSQRVIVDQAGVYPIRGIIENQGGGFNVEWYTRVGDVLYLVNSNASPQALQAWLTATGDGCYVQSALPVRSAVDVNPAQKISIELGNGATTVTSGSIVLKLDGTTVSPTITPGSPTKVELDPIGVSIGGSAYWASGSSHNVELSFTDSGATTYNYAWSFSVVTYKTIPGGLPPGSQDLTKPGFKVFTQKPVIGWTDAGEWDGNYPLTRIYAGEQLLAGYLRPNGATNQGSMVDGYFEVPTVVNWNGELDGLAWSGGPNQQGNFRDPAYPDSFPPGIPGISDAAFPNSEFMTKAGYSVETLTYLVLPQSGLYQMGVNSDDGFLVTPNLTRPAKNGALVVSSPAGVAGGYYTIHAPVGTARPHTNAPITAKLVPTDPILADTPLNNAAAVAGNIALCRRGAVQFSLKIKNCLAAGAVGFIMANNQTDTTADGPVPFEMGVGNDGYQDIPAGMITMEAADKLIAAAATGDVMATFNPVPISWDNEGALGYADYGKGSSDILFYFVAPAPGVYPFRMMFFEGGGGDNCEWFTVLPNGTKVLINDSTNPDAVKAYRAVTYVAPPVISIAQSGANIVVTYTGTLQSATTVNGTYTDVSGATSPHSVPVSSAPLFFRARQ